MSHDEVTQWLSGLARADERAVEQVWQEYFEKLVRLARKKMPQGGRREADEEDIALSAFNSFIRGAAAGRFPQLEDRDDLWKILVTITARKVSHQLRRQMQQKRGGGTQRGESAFGEPSGREPGIGAVLGAEPTPEFAASAAEQCERLLNALPDDEHRRIALLKLEGFTNEEISDAIPCSPRTVDRRLKKIRVLWEQAVE